MNYPSNDEVNLLRHNARLVVRELGLLNDAYFDIGVTLAERHLLIELSSCLYPTVGEIAERLLLDKSTASRLIAKAAKKGYIKCTSDKKDKRKRYIQFTERGKEVLNAFEPIAFNQTKDALLELTEEEREIVKRGVQLYAKGLKSSRLRKQISFTKLKAEERVSFAEFVTKLNKAAVWADLFKNTQAGFSCYIMKMENGIIGGVCISPHDLKKTSACMLSKLCLRSDMQDLELEKLLIEFSLKEAKKLGYKQCKVDITKETPISKELLQSMGFQKTKTGGSVFWKAC